VAVYLIIIIIANEIFVRFTIMKLKYNLTALFGEYSTFRIYVMFI